jgi:type IV secretory pathway VirB2 component (pilin)
MGIGEILQQIAQAFFDSDGPGGYLVLIIFILACGIYTLLTRWILAGGKRPK